MKKLLIIELHAGRVIERDLSKEKGLPIGEPANSPTYAQLCMAIATGGCSDVDHNNENQYTHIAPSSIKSVTIKFEKGLTVS